MSDLNRRRHVRLALHENAIAFDERDRELGRVAQVSGGGATIEATSEATISHLNSGDSLRVTVVEPGSQTRNTIDMVVRSRSGTRLGLEFVTGQK